MIDAVHPFVEPLSRRTSSGWAGAVPDGSTTSTGSGDYGPHDFSTWTNGVLCAVLNWGAGLAGDTGVIWGLALVGCPAPPPLPIYQSIPS